jgi:outer membrane autotransporter protein
MKRYLLIACMLISLATISHAQIKKGAVLLGGSIGVYNNTTTTEATESEINSIILHPSIGVAIRDNWVVGLQAGLSRNWMKKENVQQHKSNFFSTGLYVRNYLSLGKSFYLYGQSDLSFLQSKYNLTISTDETRRSDMKGVSFTLTPGLTYAVNKRFHLEAFLNQLIAMNYTNTEMEHTTLAERKYEEQKSFAFQSNFSSTNPLSIGFRFLLAK